MQTPNEKVSELQHKNIIRSSKENTKRLLVGWDTEFDTTNGYCPVSTQLYVLNDGKSHFIEHIRRKLTSRELIEYLHTRYPEYSDITLVTHFGKVEIMGLQDGRSLILDNAFISFDKNFIGSFSVNINGTDIKVETADTYLLHTSGLKKIGEMLGLEKLDSKGYRESGRMCEWYGIDPEGFKKYATRDAEVCVKYYDRLYHELKRLGLITTRMPTTVGAIGEDALFRIILKSDYTNLGYFKKALYIKRKMKIDKLEIPRHLRRFEDCYYGGRNETFLYGIHDGEVWCYDLRSAYPTVLSVLPEWDLLNPFSIRDAEDLYEFMKDNPLAVGYVNMNFKCRDLKYPIFPIKYDNSLVFTKSGNTICTLQEFFVAFPYLERCNIIECVGYKPIGESKIAEFVKEYREKRLEAKRTGNKFLADSLKLILNSLYGKFAQSLSKRRVLDLENSTSAKLIYTELEPSKITNPLIASFITGCVRAEIAEYLIYCDQNHIKVGNITTDGFTAFRKLDEECLKGVGHLTKYLSAQLGNDDILELDEENSGNGYLGIKTRAYAILKGKKPFCKITGVSFRDMTDEQKLKFVIDEFLNLHIFKDTRYEQKTQPSNAKWLKTGCDPVDVVGYRSFNWDYDMKRKPSDVTEVRGMPCFETIPFESLTECILWKEAYKDFQRGTRKGGKQIGTKNKLVNKTQIDQFETYTKIKSLNLEGIQRVNDKSEMRIFVNILRWFKPKLGYKKISKLLNIPISSVKYWLKNPLSEKVLFDSKGAVSAIKIYKGSLTAPSPELLNLLDLVMAEFEKWIKPQPSIINEFPGIETPISDIPPPIMGISTNDNANKDSS